MIGGQPGQKNKGFEIFLISVIILFLYSILKFKIKAIIYIAIAVFIINYLDKQKLKDLPNE